VERKKQNAGIAVMMVLGLVALSLGAEWVTKYDGGYGDDRSVGIVLSGRAVFVTGFRTASGGYSSFVTIRYRTSDGETLAVRGYQWAPGWSAEAGALAATATGNVYVVGRAVDTTTADEYTVLKYDSCLNQLWVYDTAAAEQDEAAALAVAVRGETAYTTGTRFRSDAQGLNYLTVRTRADSALRLWAADYGYRSGDDYVTDDYALAVAVGPDGSVFVTGASTGYNDDTIDADLDYATVKYDAGGTELWVARYSPTDSMNDSATAIVVDDSGNSYVTGSSSSTTGGSDIATVKYGPSGNQVWVRRYSGSGVEYDAPAAMVRGAAGDVYVTGTSVGQGRDVLTIRYSAITGDTVWTRRYNGSGNGDDEGCALAVDDEGSVYVAGYATGAGTGKDFVTLKYTSWGDLLETWTWNDTQDGDDVAVGVVVDSAHSVYVTGYGQGTNGVDIVTLRYDQQRVLVDVGIDTILSPPSSVEYGENAVPQASVFATESTALQDSVEVRMRIGSFYDDTVRALPPAGESVNVSFSPWIALQPGNHLAVCELLTPDSNPANDRKEKWVSVRGGWKEMEHMPVGLSGKQVKYGGWLAADTGSGLVYAAKGNKTNEFYRYNPSQNAWAPKKEVPDGTEAKKPYKGCRGACDGGNYVYMTKGNNTLGFWRYSVSTDSWKQLVDVPLGSPKKKVKDGADLVYAEHGGQGHVYLLKGNKKEFYRFDAADSAWHTLDSAPGTQKWKEGSFLVYDGDHSIYAHKAYYNRMWRYDTDRDSWSSELAGMPFYGQLGKKKKHGPGGGAAWYGGSLFALKGCNTQEFWRYDTAANGWFELDTMPRYGSALKKKRVKDGGDITSDRNVFYALKGNKTLEFWRYVPQAETSYDWPGAGYAERGQSGQADGGETGLSSGDDPPAEVAMSTDGIEAWSPRWNAQGTACCYVRESQGGIGAGYDQIYVRTAGAAGTEMMVTDARTDFAWPTFSPLGNMLACIVYDTISERDHVAVIPLTGGFGQEPSPQPQSDRNVVSANSLAARSMVQGLGTATAAVTGVTPGQPQAALGHDPNRPGEIRSCPSAGGTDNPVIQLTFDASDKGHVEWSPAGDWLVYEAEDEVNGYTEIRRIRWQGVEEQQLTADPAEHCLPQYLTPREIVFQWSPNDDYDRLVRMNVDTREWRILTPSDRDYEQLCPSYWGDRICYVAQDEQGVDQIGVVGREGEDARFITGDQFDKSEPDWSQDNTSIYAAQWYGLTSAIGWVSAFGSPFMPVTDGSAIRDNPDVAYMSNLCQNAVIYERENVSPTDGCGPDQKLRKGTGIFLVRHRRPQDGVMADNLGVLALQGAEPSPSTGRLRIRWQVPRLTSVSLKMYNALGQLVKTLADGQTKPGSYVSVWDGSDRKGRSVAAGIYFCQLDSPDVSISRKVVLTSSE
jgi:hypothetical protein